MANIKSAKKRIRVIEGKTQRNRRVKAHLKEILKDFEAAVAAEDRKTARDTLALAEKRLMQAASKGTIHKNAASRKVSRITAAFIKAFGSEALLEKAEKPGIPGKVAKESKVAKKVKAEKAPEPEKAEETVDAEEKPAKKSTKKASAEEAEVAEEPAEEVEAEVAEESVSEAEAEVAEEPAEEAETEVAETPSEEAQKEE